MPEKGPPKLETWAGQDFKTLELEIDKEIDSLFVPAMEKATEKAVAEACPTQHPQSLKSEPPPAPGPTANLDAIHSEIDREIDKLFVPASPSNSLPVSTTRPAPIDSAAGLSELIEQFNAAYLSLDWEFSRQNLKKFIDALERLRPMASRSQDAKSLFRIMEVILKRLLDRPRALNTKLVQLIRDSQGLLAHLLLMDGESGQHERQRLKELVEQFQELRQKALAAKAAGAGPGEPPESNSPPASAPPESNLGAEKERAAKAPASAPDPLEKSRPGVRQANVCLLVSDKKLLALPASCVVKVADATGRIGRKIIKRGYATLSDFKPPFRGLKSGVLDQWASLEAKELGSYRFETLEIDPADGSAATGQIAVLASEGQTRRIIFCDAVTFISDADIAEESRVLVPFFELSGLRRQGQD